MANEVTTRVKLSVTGTSGDPIMFDTGDVSEGLASNLAYRGEISVGTSNEAIPAGDISTFKYVALRNLSSSIAVVLNKSDDTDQIVSIGAGQNALIPISAAPYLQTASSTALVEFLIVGT